MLVYVVNAFSGSLVLWAVLYSTQLQLYEATILL